VAHESNQGNTKKAKPLIVQFQLPHLLFW